MDERWLSFLVVIIPSLVSYFVGKNDVMGNVKRSKEENKDKIYQGWEDLYTTQKAANDELRQMMAADRAETNKQLKEMEQKVSAIEEEFRLFRIESHQKEEGYKITIIELEDERDNLIERNEELLVENTELTTENRELKLEIDNLLKGEI